MVNNYVKQHFISPPVSRRYDRTTVASLVVIALLKPVYTIEEIAALTRLALSSSPDKVIYDRFCNLTETAVQHAFHGTTMEKPQDSCDPRGLLWNACNSFACQLYVRTVCRFGQEG
jgi:hypothetical protein